MTLTTLDWAIIAAYFILSLAIGLFYYRRAGESTGDYFVAGRSLPWWLAGTSMVATTFSADTPLAVTEMVAKQRHRRELAVVVDAAVRDADRLLLREALAARGRGDGRRVRGAALLREARRVSARVSARRTSDSSSTSSSWAG